MTNEQHNKYVGYAFLGNFAFQTLVGLGFGLMFFLFFLVTPPPGSGPTFPGSIIAIFLIFFVGMQLLFNLPSLIAGYAVLKQKPWARVAAFVGAAMSAMNVPVGTLACVYAIWFFAGEEWKEIYEPHNYRPRTGHLPPHADQYRATYSNTREEEQEPVPRPGDWR